MELARPVASFDLAGERSHAVASEQFQLSEQQVQGENEGERPISRYSACATSLPISARPWCMTISPVRRRQPFLAVRVHWPCGCTGGGTAQTD